MTPLERARQALARTEERIEDNERRLSVFSASPYWGGEQEDRDVEAIEAELDGLHAARKTELEELAYLEGMAKAESGSIEHHQHLLEILRSCKEEERSAE